MMMELLGQSFENIFRFFNDRFSVKIVLMLAEQILQRIEYNYNRNFLHIDIRSTSFFIATGLTCIKWYSHFIQRYQTFIDTQRFASIHVNFAIYPNRRDDLISLRYTLMYLLRGSLPFEIQNEM
ncbi:hypothetical protein ABPG72_016365 [Tetrahymena utriculariae]